MGLLDIIFRTITKAGHTTKAVGDNLSWTELDENFEHLIDEFNNLNANLSSNIAPYSALTTYSNTPTTYVTHSGNTYQYINGTPSMGNAPPNATYWLLVSNGILNHQQGTDTVLAQGTATQVTSAELYSILNEQVIVSTPAAFIALQAAGTLKPNRLYYFSANGHYLVRTLSATQYSPQAHRLLSIPNYTDHPQYDYAGVYAIGDYVTWSGVVFRNSSGTNAGTTPDTDPTNWDTMTPYSAAQYETKPVACTINISQAGVVTEYESRDECGNVYSGLGAYVLRMVAAYQHGNVCDISSILTSHNFGGTVRYNTLILSTVDIYEEINNAGVIGANHFENAIVSFGVSSSTNLFRGTVQTCKFENVTVNFPDGFLISSSLIGVLIDLDDKTKILNIPDDISLNGKYLTMEGGNAEIEVGVTTGTDIDMTSFVDYAEIYGIYSIDAGAGATIDTISNASPYQKIKIVPKTGSGNITINTSTFAAPIAANEFHHSSGAAIVIKDGTPDYIIVQYKTVGGTNFWDVLEQHIS
jgi:hypothetical protein